MRRARTNSQKYECIEPHYENFLPFLRNVLGRIHGWIAVWKGTKELLYFSLFLSLWTYSFPSIFSPFLVFCWTSDIATILSVLSQRIDNLIKNEQYKDRVTC